MCRGVFSEDLHASHEETASFRSTEKVGGAHANIISRCCKKCDIVEQSRHATPVNLAKGTGSGTRRVSLWNTRENRLIEGNAAPMERNLQDYLKRHPDCEVFRPHELDTDQIQLPPHVTRSRSAVQGKPTGIRRVAVWDKRHRRVIEGNAAPMERNLWQYLRQHPDCEVYRSQDKEITADESGVIGGVLGCDSKGIRGYPPFRIPSDSSSGSGSGAGSGCPLNHRRATSRPRHRRGGSQTLVRSELQACKVPLQPADVEATENCGGCRIVMTGDLGSWFC